MLAWTPTRFDLAQSGEREPVEGIFASGEYFETLGVTTIRGRTFTAADDRPGGGPDGPVAVISYGLWQRRFGGADGAIGTRLAVDGLTVTIVGVTPPQFRGVDVGRAFEVAVPLHAEPLIRPTRSPLPTSRLLVMLRLKPGQSVDAGTATMRAVQTQILGVTPEGLTRVQPVHYREPFTLVPSAAGTSLPVRGPTGLRQAYERPLLTILAVVMLVLLIACVDIANLLLARGAARRHELSVRLALGAGQGHLARQLLIESLGLALLGAIAGLVLASWGSQALVAQLSTPADRITLNLTLDWRLLAFTAVITVVTTAVFGTLPAFRVTRIDPMDALKVQGRAVAPHAARHRRLAGTSAGLVIVQIAVSLALVISAALFVRSFVDLSRVPLGFDPDRVLVVNVDTQRTRTNPAHRIQLFQRIVEAAASAPDVAHAGGSIWTPVDGGMRMGDSQDRIAFNFITPGWFAAYGTAIRAGRDFTGHDATDATDAPPVVIVNDAFVRAFIHGRSPLGETVPYPRSRTGPVQRTIVGVVGDTVFDSQREGIQPIVYLPVAQSAAFARGATEISLGVRPSAGPPLQIARSVGAALRDLDPVLSFAFRPLSDDVRASVRQERLLAMLFGFFGALALLLAALGLYGVTSYTVNRRSAEFGIRMALGARRPTVLRLALGRSLALTVVGIGLGLAAAAAVTRSFRGLLFGLTPLDPMTFLGVAALFAVVAGIAATLPAHRATRIDPIIALRHD